MPGHGATRSFHYYPIVLIGLTFAITSASVELASPPSPQNLVIGTSTALSGPAKEIGLDVVGGINAAFIEANRNASQSGFVVQLVTRDDAYDPAKTAENMEALIKKDKVIAVLGNVGSPTAVVSVLMANEHRIPFIGAYSGAGLLRKSPPDRYVVNFRASYDEEVASMIRGFVDVAGVSPTSIAFFTQRDAFGDASFNGGHRELTQHNLPSGYFIPHLRYERSGAGVESAVADLLLLPETPRVVIMAGT